MEYLLLTLILIIVGMVLKNWQPPIKKQYVVILLLIVGSGLGVHMVTNWMVGFYIAGLTFYKDELVEEAKLVANSYKGLNKLSKGDEIDD